MSEDLRLLIIDDSEDDLTGLLMRGPFLEQLKLVLARSRRSQSTVGLVFIDLDGFKPINDRYGHQAGDTILREVADRISAVVRKVDAVGRFGGDEFVAILEGLGADPSTNVEIVCQRLVEAVADRPFHVSGDTVSVSLSLGVSIWDPRADNTGADADEGMELINRADAAMYKAKRSESHLAQIDGGGPLFERRVPSRVL